MFELAPSMLVWVAGSDAWKEELHDTVGPLLSEDSAQWASWGTVVEFKVLDKCRQTWRLWVSQFVLLTGFAIGVLRGRRGRAFISLSLPVCRGSVAKTGVIRQRGHGSLR